MDTRTFVIGQLALFSWREGMRLAPGCEDAILAIAYIMYNRMKAGWNSGDWLQILSSVASHSAEEPQDMLTFNQPDPWDPLWRRLVTICGDIYNGQGVDTLTRTPDRYSLASAVPGADQVKANQQRVAFFYANMQQPVRPWFTENIVTSPEAHPRIGTVGTITLFG